MSTIQTDINKLRGRIISTEHDSLAVEEPLEIRMSFIRDLKRTVKTISITMRTPGNDKELALGFLFTEGIIQNRDQVQSVEVKSINTVEVILNDFVEFEMKNLEKHFYTSSSCGVCGKTSIEAINTIYPGINEDNLIISSETVKTLPGILRQKQNIFEQTGGLHASAVFDLYGSIILLNEDVGRHNALDKLIGTAFEKNLLPLSNHILLLSGRASFELIQKATMAGLKIVAAVGAPSSLAMQLAEERDMTLIGFLREDRFNIYSGIKRITF